MTGRRTKHGGFTLVELMVVVLIIALLIAILLPALARARAYARTVACASNMRQFGAAITTYAAEQDDKMLPVDMNYWHCLAIFLGEGTKENSGSDVFRCATDDFKSTAAGNAGVKLDRVIWVARSDGTGGDWVNTTFYPVAGPGDGETYSYAPNYAADVSLDSVALHGSNDLNTPFSYAETGRVRRLGGTAPDTFLFIESWGECVGDLDRFGPGQTVGVGFNEGVNNRIMLTVGNAAALYDGGLASPWWRMRPAIKDYRDTQNALTLNALTRRFSKNDGNNKVLAHHWLLTMVQAEESYDDAFHIGVINVLSADGHVDGLDVLRLGQMKVGEDGRWSWIRD